MNNSLHADVLIIGWGKGGKAAAADLGKLGKRVVLVEQSERMYGGTCPNIGCVPSKGLVHRSGKRRPTEARSPTSPIGNTAPGPETPFWRACRVTFPPSARLHPCGSVNPTSRTG
jgi:pyruvate/2-oxoglutarate dehydrogenase complex dihydrolipoamide dehydrogenase (E3) component